MPLEKVDFLQATVQFYPSENRRVIIKEPVP
jgi:hypothetical protein